MKSIVIALMLTLLFASAALAEDAGPGSKDKCPVCGMFVAGYADWLAGVDFTDGARAWFDGPKDMMKYCLDIEKYAPSRKKEDIASMFVTEYYGLKAIDAKKAYYVIGSDVMGPMGKELVPFGEEAAAEEFMRDHKGRAVLGFGDISAETIKELR